MAKCIKTVCKSTKKDGYTLIEAIIVILIVCSLMVIAVKPRDMSMGQKAEQVTGTFKYMWEAMNRRAIVKNVGFYVKYYSQAKYIKFISDDGHYKKLILPPGIECYGLQPAIHVFKDGAVPPRTVKFKTKLGEKRLKIQMFWGRIIES